MNLNAFSIRILYGRTDILLCTDCLYRLFAVLRVWLEKAYRNCLYSALWETLREEGKERNGVTILGKVDDFTISSQVVIAETVIVGQVPDMFLQTGGKYEFQRENGSTGSAVE